MKEPLDLSRGLMNKAANDLRAAEIGTKNDAPLDTVAFHLQQSVEKVIKAFLNWKQVQYPKTHALSALLDRAVPLQPDLEAFRQRLLAMGSYAVEMRYDDELYPTNEEIDEGLQTARAFREKIESLLPPPRLQGQTRSPNSPPLEES